MARERSGVTWIPVTDGLPPSASMSRAAVNGYGPSKGRARYTMLAMMPKYWCKNASG